MRGTARYTRSDPANATIIRITERTIHTIGTRCGFVCRRTISNVTSATGSVISTAANMASITGLAVSDSTKGAIARSKSEGIDTQA